MERKKHIKYARLTDRELAALNALIAKEHRPISNMLRECIRREAVRQGLWQEAEEVA